MPAAERWLEFVVVGRAPAALALPAAGVRNVLTERQFSGTALDLRALGAAKTDAGGHVLFVGDARAPVGLHVRGGIELLKVRASDVLPLPDVVGGPAWLSHVIAPRGVPSLFVLDLARLDASRSAGCPWDAHAVHPET
jgi:hypothetical protein